MFDIGWGEMAVIAVVALIVIGPRDLPRVLYTMGRWAGKARGMLRELQQGMEEIAREAELEDMKKKFEAARKLDVKREIGNAIDPDGQMAKALDPIASGNREVPRSRPELEEDEEPAPAAAASPPAAPAPGVAASGEPGSGADGRPAQTS